MCPTIDGLLYTYTMATGCTDYIRDTSLKGEASRLRIMVAGETDVGKSTILNSLVGTKVFEVGRASKQRVTIKATEKICIKDGIIIVAIDCPGLHDGTENEAQCIQEMKDAIDKHNGIDLLLYCRKMDVTRADVVSDADIIRKLTEGLGAEIWRHALFVLTHANIYEKVLEKTRGMSQDEIKGEFKARQKEWKKTIEESMKACKVKCCVEVCPAGHKKPQLCGRPYWLSDFWASVCNVLQKNGGNKAAVAALVRLSQSIMIQQEEVPSQEEDFKYNLELGEPIVLKKQCTCL